VNFPKHLLHWFEQRQAELCHRQLLVVTGDEKWAIDTITSLLDHSNKKNILWVGNSQDEHTHIAIKNYRSQLGHEYDWVVLNCFNGFRANAAIALSGTIKAQGLMVLLCPDFSKWPHYADPEHLNRTSYGYQHTSVKSFFIQHLISSFKADSSVAILSPDNRPSNNRLSNNTTNAQFSGKTFYVADNLETRRYSEQETAVNSICKVAQGHRNRPLVLTADRGRGKSSALGIAAAKLMIEGIKTIKVTALHIDNTEQIFKHAQRILLTASTIKNGIAYQTSTLSFIPIDQLLSNDESISMVLVDEAASLPIHVLIKLASKFPRIVFSSTIHGYEGSGRGFEMRFIKQLSQLKPGFKRLHMSQPIRWYKHDTLEQFWFNTLFHNEIPKPENIEVGNHQISCQHISKAQLIEDKKLLGSVFKLLIDAHYQTSQDDLQRLLDAPEIECFILTAGNALLGMAQIVAEGGSCVEALANDIANCTRRVKGHLVAQNIASSYNNTSFLLAHQWRITRIAIHPKHQRKGLGNKLINYVEQQARQQHITFLTTSFGCNPDILRFWCGSQFLLAKVSAKPEVSSGEHSAICIKSLTNEGLEMTVYIYQEHYSELLYQIDKNFQYMPQDMIMQILLLEPDTHSSTRLSTPKDLEILWQFAIGKRAYTTCKRRLREYLLINPAYLLTLSVQQQNLLVAALLQNLTDKELCSKFSLSGKKQIEEGLKVSFKKLLAKQPSILI
jgi:tRNA(Met) cytidine acetyltransferase